ncbi:energy conserving hydrogenase EhbF [Methanobrevibacter curvatus]|uniref:Na(+)/H(+) antiporter subunit D n=1 Tax=Methanobrevibacter curvatus TaxID=49547 RepID=A0A166C5D6_9EURY|nr:energy conserving hydrogenase EhbF [Methanobrevibacter curvatus]KZX14146.1 Na(+)/H(+) antiporter subunit D [Methanobrevibacter curvatus]
MNELIPLMVIIPITCALLLNLFHGYSKPVKYLSFVVALILPIIPFLANYGLHFFGGHVPLIDNSLLLNQLPSNISSSIISNFHPGIVYSFNSLSKIFIFFFGIVTFLAIFSYISQNKKVSGAYLFLIFMGVAAIVALILTDDIFNMYIFFEISALTQVGIILASKIKNNYEVALKYLFLGSIGGPMMLMGIGFLLGLVGSVNIADIMLAINSGFVDPLSPLFLLSFGLIFFGWLYSVGLPPFHVIKASVYSKALPSASAIIQGFSVMTFIAIGLIIIRIFSVVKFVNAFIIFFSLAGMILSLVLALSSNDFRKTIGFLAVGEIGYIGLGFGIGTPLSITAGLFQGLNELIISALLFIGFGTILYFVKTSKLSKLGGLISYHPKIALFVLIGGLAMAGVPPLNGFQSKLALVQSALSAGYPELAVIMILLSIITFTVFVNVFHRIYLKPKPLDLEVKPDVVIPRSTVFSILILLIICIILGIIPNIVTTPLFNYVGALI